MAAFDSDAFFTDAFDEDAFDFAGIGLSTASDGGDLWPPRANDPRWVAFVAAQGVSFSHDVGYDVRLALALSLGLTAAQAAAHSVDDMFKKYKDSVGVVDFDSDDPFPPP